MAARRAVSSLRARGGGCDHRAQPCGHGNGQVTRAENAAGIIAGIEGVSAVIAGHTHEMIVRPATATTAPIVKAGLCRLASGGDLVAVAGAPGAWHVDTLAEALPATDTPCPALADTLKAVPADIASRLTRPSATRPCR